MLISLFKDIVFYLFSWWVTCEAGRNSNLHRFPRVIYSWRCLIRDVASDLRKSLVLASMQKLQLPSKFVNTPPHVYIRVTLFNFRKSGVRLSGQSSSPELKSDTSTNCEKSKYFGSKHLRDNYDVLTIPDPKLQRLERQTWRTTCDILPPIYFWPKLQNHGSIGVRDDFIPRAVIAHDFMARWPHWSNVVVLVVPCIQ